MNREHLESIQSRLLEKGIHLSQEEVKATVALIKDEILQGGCESINPSD